MAENAKEQSWLERYLGLAVAAAAILGGVVSAYATQSFTQGRELGKSHLELRMGAYSNFLAGQTLLRKARQERTSEEEANRMIGEAKLHIFLTGSPEVVCPMARYWTRVPISPKEEELPVCKGPEEKRKDVAIYQAMRKEVFDALGADDPGLSATVAVPYLRGCVLPGTNPDRVCARP